ncbi:MAG: hypothetical protein L6R35_004073, partial [Caloplaca aegaea]
PTLFITVRQLGLFLGRDPDPANHLVLDYDFKSLFSINVAYTETRNTVDLGNKVKPVAVSSTSDVIVHAISKHFSATPTLTIRRNVTYTIALTDLDATSQSDPAMAEMCHWLIPGTTLGDSSVYYIVRLPISMETMQKASQSTDSKLQGTGHSSNVKELVSYYLPGPPSRAAIPDRLSSLSFYAACIEP